MPGKLQHAASHCTYSSSTSSWFSQSGRNLFNDSVLNNRWQAKRLKIDDKGDGNERSKPRRRSVT